jgi:hypothetical protein
MLLSLQETTELIEKGRSLTIAGDENLLSKLPKGNWIGGTSPYFMAKIGGIISKEHLSVQDYTDIALGATIKSYDTDDLPKINNDSPEHGFSLVIIPAFSQAHVAYAQGAPNFPGFFMKPILGWISGFHLDDLGKTSAKIFNGLTGNYSDKKAIAIHCPIEESKNAVVKTLNLFEQGSGDIIKFEEEGFSVKNCLVNGAQRNFAEYLKENKIDTRLPLVQDCCGVAVNVSFQAINEADGTVAFYAPVFSDVEYKIAAPVDNYVEAFNKKLPKDVSPAFTCNCILNFLYSELEGKVVDKMHGPVTFGEIAYQLVNQTLVYLEVS